ncbi:MAG: type I-U CRISPR-associated protein Cas5/Cas6 [Chloroflexi bacterium]|nr:type I-U CRISPR-associated protein Cas5/Cas6 [Chloroflexota bacterium]
MSGLLITVRLHDERYHGMGDWPPSPARLFQALVAGAGLSGPLDREDCVALEWLQELKPPLIAAPAMLDGQSFVNYVPNNDLDAKGGDARRIASIRTTKPIRPRVFDAEAPLLYAWAFDHEEDEGKHGARAVCALADRLYQFGRGVDLAWAWGEVLDNNELDARLAAYPGVVYRPSDGGSGRPLACPGRGSLASLRQRYAANGQRFKTDGQGNVARQLFSQPPKPHFMQVAYDSTPSRRLYELRERSREAAFSAWPLAHASRLVVLLRDGAAERLRALPDRGAEIERVLVGRKADGADDGPTSLRVRIVPLPSIGHQHADHGIRRVLVEVPAGCSLRADDMHWAFSGLELSDPATGEVPDLVLTPSNHESMLAHYGAADGVQSRTWRTVTPAALPEHASRRRIDPARVAAEAKDGAERAMEQGRAAAAVVQALRHAEVRTRPTLVRVQREPFEAKGERAEAFAPGTRFAKERLWHVEITFDAPIAGPLAIGDGRFLGLGVMAPLRRVEDVHAFAIEGGLAATPQPTEVARALRRAVMARVQEVLGPRTGLPAFFTGHESDGSRAQTERRPHLTYAFDPRSARLLVIAPYVIDRRAATREELGHLDILEKALTHFRELRAGSAGLLVLRANPVDAQLDPLFAASRTWESVTAYEVTRHTKHVGAAEALAADLRAECRRRSLPEPRVTPRELRGVSGVGLVGGAQLAFDVAVAGPIVLGRSRHLGGGLFTGTATVSGYEGLPAPQRAADLL